MASTGEAVAEEAESWGLWILVPRQPSILHIPNCCCMLQGCRRGVDGPNLWGSCQPLDAVLVSEYLAWC
jgi:hypothetical protein